MKLHKQKNTVLNAEDKFADNRDSHSAPKDLTQLSDIAIALLNDKNLEVSKVRPFFWSLVETYVDRFQLYPFDVKKALFSYLELNDYPEETMLKLVKQLESQFENAHGRGLREQPVQVAQQESLDDGTRQLRDAIKYAALVAEKDD